MFVPLFFLAGFSSVLFRQLSVVVIFSLLMALFVAVTIVPVLCALVLTPPVPADQRTGLTGRLFTWSERVLDGMDEGYRKLLHLALAHRPTVVGVSALLFVASIFVFSTLSYELMPQTDEGEVTVEAENAVGTRIERMEATMAPARGADPPGRPRGADAGDRGRRLRLPGVRRPAPRHGHGDPVAARGARALERRRSRPRSGASSPAWPARSSAPGRRAATSSCSASWAAAPTPASPSRSAATTSTTRDACRTTPSC